MSGERVLDTARHGRLRRARGVSAVEFALVAPIAFVIILSVVVVSIVVMHQTQLANVSRDVARAAAICGSAGSNNGTRLPDGQACSDSTLLAYAQAQLDKIDSTWTWAPTVTVVDAAGAPVAGNSIGSCQRGYTVHIAVTYAQSLYVPIVSGVFGNAPGGARTLNASGVATCEQ